MKWGLLAGLGEGLKFTSAAMYEQAKAAELQKIRQQERAEDRKHAVEDREARKTDAIELSQAERDNAGKWEQVLDEKGEVIAQKHSVTGETKPLDIRRDNNRLANINAYLTKTDRDFLEPAEQLEYDRLNSFYLTKMLEEADGIAGSGTGSIGGATSLGEEKATSVLTQPPPPSSLGQEDQDPYKSASPPLPSMFPFAASFLDR